MNVRPRLTLVMAGSLMWNCAVARPIVLGMMLEVDRAHLNDLKVRAGATIYDGDRFSTETGGMLRLRRGTARLELAEASVIIVRNPPTGAQGIEVNLQSGTLVFRSERVTSLDVVAQEASIRAAADARTVAKIAVTGLKELRIHARRGAPQFSYRGETETLAEGQSYRVILDRPDNGPKEGPPPASKLPKGSKS